MRERLAKVLQYALWDSSAVGDLTGSDTLLEELRVLARAHPTDASVSEALARALNSIHFYLKGAGDLAREDAILNELRALAEAHPDDDTVQRIVAPIEGT